MEAFIDAFLGPFKPWVLAFSLAIVVLTRRSIRKRHLIGLAVITVLAFVAFFTFLLWGIATLDGTQNATLWQGVLGVIAGIVVGCGSAVGFSLLLKSLGLASLDDR